MIKKTWYIEKPQTTKVEKLALRRKKLTESQIVRYAIDRLNPEELLAEFDNKE